MFRVQHVVYTPYLLLMLCVKMSLRCRVFAMKIELAAFPASAVHRKVLITFHSQCSAPKQWPNYRLKTCKPKGRCHISQGYSWAFSGFKSAWRKTTTGNRPLQGETQVLFYLCPTTLLHTHLSFFVSAPWGARPLCPRKLTCPGWGEWEQ